MDTLVHWYTATSGIFGTSGSWEHWYTGTLLKIGTFSTSGTSSTFGIFGTFGTLVHWYTRHVWYICTE